MKFSCMILFIELQATIDREIFTLKLVGVKTFVVSNFHGVVGSTKSFFNT